MKPLLINDLRKLCSQTAWWSTLFPIHSVHYVMIWKMYYDWQKWKCKASAIIGSSSAYGKSAASNVITAITWSHPFSASCTVISGKRSAKNHRSLDVFLASCCNSAERRPSHLITVVLTKHKTQWILTQHFTQLKYKMTTCTQSSEQPPTDSCY